MKQTKKQVNSKNGQKGSALIFATIILFSLLAITVTLSAITVQDMKMSQKTKSSTGAFFNADSGVEWALNKIANSNSDLTIGSATAFNDPNIGDGVACPFGGCNLFLLDATGTVIIDGSVKKLSDIKAVRSVGTQGADTQRAIEAAVAADATCSGVPTQISALQPTATFAVAAKACRIMGTCWHLPSTEELGIFVDPANVDDWLWTTTYNDAHYNMLMRTHNGQVDHQYYDQTYKSMCVK